MKRVRRLPRAIACSPLRAGCYYDLVRCRKIGADDGALISQMREAASLPGLEPAQRSRVELALGKAAHDLGDFEAAMRHFDAAEAFAQLGSPLRCGPICGADRPDDRAVYT